MCSHVDEPIILSRRPQGQVPDEGGELKCRQTVKSELARRFSAAVSGKAVCVRPAWRQRWGGERARFQLEGGCAHSSEKDDRDFLSS